MIHPVIRIALLGTAAAGLAAADWPALALGAALLITLYAGRRFAGLGQAMAMARRLRIFYLTIALVYLWFTPGEPLWAALGPVSPSRAGLWLALERVGALLLLVAAVQLLLQSTTRGALLAAIRWWARPLVVFGLEPQRLALRLVLVLDSLPRLRELVPRPSMPAGAPRLSAVADYAADTVARVLDEAEHAPLPRVDVPESAPPACWQWSLPLLLGAALWYL
ncbi:hypothetical protein [Alkalilimnicola sp. S0819]|uniref:hypothetical protein n=1 Tax=Alkalilimnicola sp. S0819 TaxID=2613922 RepID=UPI0012613E66|nr:hypothetical protein [Alkalilimnicola sp. S0819]KAB7627858.1 hypothetical protein F3N43_02465 [Alkalilimnicola sp. S0819]MPQ15492.1 hypothetical protein [Alkalilimnicola sp. S0819]